MLEEILEFNQEFVVEQKFKQYATSKFPDKKIAIVTCMDTRLEKLLPAALGLENGDAKIIKNAGAIISQPFGSVMRSLILGIYSLQVEEILVIGHTDCGACNADGRTIIHQMIKRGISKKNLDLVEYFGTDVYEWMHGFKDLESSVINSVEIIKHHPLMPEDVKVYGLIIHSITGELRQIT